MNKQVNQSTSVMSVIDSVLPNIGLDARVFYHQPFKIKTPFLMKSNDQNMILLQLVYYILDSLSDHSNDLFPNISIRN